MQVFVPRPVPCPVPNPRVCKTREDLTVQPPEGGRSNKSPGDDRFHNRLVLSSVRSWPNASLWFGTRRRTVSLRMPRLVLAVNLWDGT
jgi:hypothetical protein